MLKTVRKELAESVIVGIFIGVLTSIAEWLIKDQLIRSIVVGIGLLSILAVLLLPHARRLVRAYSYAVLNAYQGFYERCCFLHQLVHNIRDMIIELLPTATLYRAPELEAGVAPKSHPLLEKNRDKIISLLDGLARLFQLLVPSEARVWVCMRDLRADDCYHTFARAGYYTPNRAESSSPLHREKSRIMQRLDNALKYNGVCVLISGSSMGPRMWEHQDNDKYGEDQSVMLGAVFTKSWDEQQQKSTNVELAWILGVCANTENAFSEKHIPLMQACVDVFSILANIIIRFR